MKKTHLILLALLAGTSLSTSVFAHDSIGFSLNIGSPYYYEPPQVYYAPPPVVYYEPRPVYRGYYNPYYYPRIDRYYDNDGWRRHHKRHGHRGHDDDDD